MNLKESIALMERHRPALQTALNLGKGWGEIARDLKVRYEIFSWWMLDKGMVAWPELGDMERITFVDFIRGKVSWDGKPRMVTKQARSPKIVMDVDEYVRLSCIVAAYEQLNQE